MSEDVVIAAKGAGTGILSGITATAAGAELWQIIIVGLIGGIVGWMRRYDHDAFKEDKRKVIMGAPAAIATPMALAAVTYYGGVSCSHQCEFSVERFFLISIAFIFSLYYDTVIEFSGKLIPGVLEKFGLKVKRKEPMSDYEE